MIFDYYIIILILIHQLFVVFVLDIYIFLLVSFFSSSVERISFKRSSFGDFGCNSVQTRVILSAILLPIKSPVASEVFWIALFEVLFITCVAGFLALSRSFWPYILLILLENLVAFLLIFLASDKNLYAFTYIPSLGSIEYLIFIIAALSDY